VRPSLALLAHCSIASRIAIAWVAALALLVHPLGDERIARGTSRFRSVDRRRARLKEFDAMVEEFAKIDIEALNKYIEENGGEPIPYVPYKFEYDKPGLDAFRRAQRANYQLAVALRAQGLHDYADHFALRAHVLQRAVLKRERKLLRYLGSLFLGLISGYGYKPLNAFITYLLVVGVFALIYLGLGNNVQPPLDPLGAVVFSITSFHGRGFAPGENVAITNPVTVIAAVEAMIGLLIEVTFIATFTQRFFSSR
jgi:hypothetical protein